MSFRPLVISLFVGSLLLSAKAEAASTVVHRMFTSATLSRDYAYNVYLPDGYDTSGLSYPVLYLLHGSGGSENSWLGDAALPQIADRLIESGAVPPAIIVGEQSLSARVDYLRAFLLADTAPSTSYSSIQICSPLVVRSALPPTFRFLRYTQPPKSMRLISKLMARSIGKCGRSSTTPSILTHTRCKTLSCRSTSVPAIMTPSISPITALSFIRPCVYTNPISLSFG